MRIAITESRQAALSDALGIIDIAKQTGTEITLQIQACAPAGYLPDQPPTARGARPTQGHIQYVFAVTNQAAHLTASDPGRNPLTRVTADKLHLTAQRVGSTGNHLQA